MLSCLRPPLPRSCSSLLYLTSSPAGTESTTTTTFLSPSCLSPDPSSLARSIDSLVAQSSPRKKSDRPSRREATAEREHTASERGRHEVYGHPRQARGGVGPPPRPLRRLRLLLRLRHLPHLPLHHLQLRDRARLCLRIHSELNHHHLLRLQRRRWPSRASAAGVRGAGPLRVDLERDAPDVGHGHPRHLRGPPRARALQPAGVRAGRGVPSLASSQPRRADGVPGGERVLRQVPGAASPGDGSLRRVLHHQGAGLPWPAGGGAGVAAEGVPPHPEPALLRVPPRHQRPTQRPLRRALGHGPHRRTLRVEPQLARPDAVHLHHRRAGAVRRHGSQGPTHRRAGPRLPVRGGAGAQQGVSVRREPRRRQRHPVARPLRHPRCRGRS